MSRTRYVLVSAITHYSYSSSSSPCGDHLPLSLFLLSFYFPSDCELVALLEDDTGMELLVCNKIVSLDLPVKEVFKKIWCAQPNVSSEHIVHICNTALADIV